ncbi:hypothetical protein Cgig2_002929 [Carnegiea gigantea]|uniref:Uncharacterized protein n=1 Tax=Carnegiea gigantea TaxID=171969 RepID=A0A9Q1GFM1_9CARY|nr:hypothetical protein Cgig2_002929 [Carnegiea gigantea]
MVIDSPDCPRPKPTFQFCDMWIRDSCFLPLVTSKVPTYSHMGPFQKLKLFLRDTKIALNQNLFLEDPSNSELKQKEKEPKDKHIRILSSVIDIIRQQCKAEWITYGDDALGIGRNWWQPRTCLLRGSPTDPHGSGKEVRSTQFKEREKMITYAILVAAIYQIWKIRNERIFSHHQQLVQTQFMHTQDHITQRILTLNSITGKYDKCTDRLIGKRRTA